MARENKNEKQPIKENLKQENKEKKHLKENKED